MYSRCQFGSSWSFLVTLSHITSGWGELSSRHGLCTVHNYNVWVICVRHGRGQEIHIRVGVKSDGNILLNDIEFFNGIYGGMDIGMLWDGTLWNGVEWVLQNAKCFALKCPYTARNVNGIYGQHLSLSGITLYLKSTNYSDQNIALPFPDIIIIHTCLRHMGRKTN